MADAMEEVWERRTVIRAPESPGEGGFKVHVPGDFRMSAQGHFGFFLHSAHDFRVGERQQLRYMRPLIEGRTTPVGSAGLNRRDCQLLRQEIV